MTRVQPESPTDQAVKIRRAKAELREHIGDVEGVFADVDEAMHDEVASIVAAKNRGDEVIPTVQFSEIRGGTVPTKSFDAIRRRGCVVVRQTFARSEAENWNTEIGNYLERNNFAATYRKYPNVLPSRPDGEPMIYPIYWSKPQVLARQDPRMNATRALLNSLWHSESEGRTWFDGTRETVFGDRLRRRRPGDSFAGLGPHVDGGALERWTSSGSRKVYRHVFAGDWRMYEPWDAAYRTDPGTYSVFRTFQGWTALSDMQPGDGVLHVVPIANAIVYLLLRPLLHDVDDVDLLLDPKTPYSFWVTERHHPVFSPAQTPIPAVEPGDTVWWHTDTIHSVADVAGLQRWGNVMYIPSAPLCDLNAEHSVGQREAFLRGSSPIDSSEPEFEANWEDRGKVEDLTEVGRKQFGIDPW